MDGGIEGVGRPATRDGGRRLTPPGPAPRSGRTACNANPCLRYVLMLARPEPLAAPRVKYTVFATSPRGLPRRGLPGSGRGPGLALPPLSRCSPPSRRSSAATPPPDMLRLAFGLAFADLYTREGALALDARFVDALRAADAPLAERLLAARRGDAALDLKAESDLQIAVAPHLEDFLATLFGIEAEVRALAAQAPRVRPAVRDEAAVRPAQGDEQVQGGRRRGLRRPGAARGTGSAHRPRHHRPRGRARLRQRGDRVGPRRGGERGGLRSRAALRRLGRAHGAGPRRDEGRRAVPCAAQARLLPAGARSRPRR